jgi:hypothetical protein
VSALSPRPSYLFDGGVNRGVVANVKLNDGNALFAQRIGLIMMFTGHIAHRREHRMSGASQSFCQSRPKPLEAPVIRIVLDVMLDIVGIPSDSM